MKNFVACIVQQQENFLKELQISEKCLLQTAVSEMEREANTFTSNASPAINLSAIDATEENITLYLANCKKSLDVELIGYNKEMNQHSSKPTY